MQTTSELHPILYNKTTCLLFNVLHLQFNGLAQFSKEFQPSERAKITSIRVYCNPVLKPTSLCIFPTELVSDRNNHFIK